MTYERSIFKNINIISIQSNLFVDRRISPNGKAAVLPAGGRSASGGKTVNLFKALFFMYIMYVLKSLKDGKMYIGHTANIKKRFNEHQKGKVRSTKSRRPFKLIYTEEYSTKSEAFKREMFLKTGQGRKFLQTKLKDILED